MDQNFAAWMIAGGLRGDDPHAARDREQLHAFRKARRELQAELPSPLARLRLRIAPTSTRPDPACCPA